MINRKIFSKSDPKCIIFGWYLGLRRHAEIVLRLEFIKLQ